MRFLCLFVFLAWSAPAAVLYSVQAVGLANATGGVGLNNAGTVVGYSTDSGLQKHAWTHTANAKTATEIGSGAMTGGINNTGAIAGTAFRDAAPEAVIWNPAPGPVLQDAYGLDINDTGYVTGGGVHGNRGSAFVQNANQTTWLDLGWWSSAYDISNNGDVVGYYLTGSTSRAFKWSSASGAVTLKTPQGRATYAHALNDAGTVAGSAEFRRGNLTAAVWSNGGLRDLGTLGGNQSAAYGISGIGAVVGSSLDRWSKRRAFLWDGTEMQDLNSMIEASSGWVLEEASAINDAGQIAGLGTWNGTPHAFLLTPIAVETQTTSVAPAEVPEPATFLVVAVAVALFGLGRYGSRLQRRC